MQSLLGLAVVSYLGVTAAVVTEVGPPVATFDFVAPILSTGMVGIILLMVLFRIKIMPTYVHEDAKREWERERSDLQEDISELKQTLKEANGVYTQQVIPTLTRVLDAERELVDLRRNERMTGMSVLRGPSGS